MKGREEEKKRKMGKPILTKSKQIGFTKEKSAASCSVGLLDVVKRRTESDI